MPSELVAAEDGWALRLFFSVDLVGSTAFKNLQRRQGDDIDDVTWCEPFLVFFEGFSAQFRDECANFNENIIPGGEKKLEQPAFWKMLGDELLFQVKLSEYRQAHRYLCAFAGAIRSYNQMLAEQESRGQKSMPLRGKGTCWLAGFPVTNIPFPVIHTAMDGTGEFASLDFIGPSIDCGFRLSKHSNPRKIVISVELALVMAKAVTSGCSLENENWHYCLKYDGRHELKGVLNNEPYPIFWLDIKEDRSGKEEEWLIVKADEVLEVCDNYIKSKSLLQYPFIAGDHPSGFPLDQREDKADLEARRLKAIAERRKDDLADVNSVGGEGEGAVPAGTLDDVLSVVKSLPSDTDDTSG